MKKALVGFLTLVLLEYGCATKIPPIQEKPLNPKACRALELQSLFEFGEAPSEFSFKRPPQALQVDSRGFVYVQDQDRPPAGPQNRLLKFSPEGRFVGNLLKIETSFPAVTGGYYEPSFLIWHDEIYVCDGTDKIVRINKEGKRVGIVPLAPSRYHRLVAMCEDGYIMFTQTMDRFSGPDGYRDEMSEVARLSWDGKASEKIAGFTSRVYKMTEGKRVDLLPWESFLSAFDPARGMLYFTYTDEYRINKVDLARMKVVATFTRKYPRVPGPSRVARPDMTIKEYYRDIDPLSVCDGNLWVATSTRDGTRGRLFDVFDTKERFLDSFFIPLRQARCCLPSAGGYLYSVLQNDNKKIVLVKYRILNGPNASSRP